MSLEYRIDNSYTLEKALELRRLAPERIEEERLRHLRAHLHTAAAVPFYSRLFQECGLRPEDITSFDGFRELPLTSREDLDANPELFGSRDREMFRDIALTSGTTGTPIVVPYTARDLDRLAFNEAVAFHASGVRPGDRVLLTVTLDRCFIAGLAYYSGVTCLGAAAIRSGPGQPERQWQIIDQLRPSCIVGVPSFLVELGEWGLANGRLDGNGGSGVERLITIGEPCRKSDFTPTAQGMRLQQLWGAELFSSYGATEFETAFGECTAGRGGHIHPELMIAEIIDEAGRPVVDGTAGEVVVTPLGVQGFPLVRFRTGDVARIHRGLCDCGWETPRLGPVEGRLAQRLKFRGTTFYPESIFFSLQEWLPEAVACVEVRQAADGADDVCVVVGSDDPELSPERIETFLQARLRVRPRIQLKPRGEVERLMRGHGGRKAKRFFDFRP